MRLKEVDIDRRLIPKATLKGRIKDATPRGMRRLVDS